MRPRKILASFLAAAALMVVAAFGQTLNSDATVLKVAGDATVTVGGATSPLKVGAKLSPGATITTGADSEVYLQAHTGTIATVKANSVVSIDELSVTREAARSRRKRPRST